MRGEWYEGEFVSTTGTTWRVEIWCDREEDAPGQPLPLVFDADEPLVIEWEHRDKEEPLCGSSAVLRVISPTDRAYVGLYTIEAMGVRLDVYREGALYWRGHLDPEHYEEPYEAADGYTVSLTFSDLGVLERLDYAGEGVPSVAALIRGALTSAGLGTLPLDLSMCTTTDPERPDNDASATLSDLCVYSENFYDEEGKPCNLKEVVEGVCQPLALKIRQNCGRIYIYDLNGLYNSSLAERVEWAGDRQTLSVDKVASRAVVSFSPYGSASVMSSEAGSGGAKYGPTLPLLATTPVGTDYMAGEQRDGDNRRIQWWQAVLPDYSDDYINADGTFKPEAVSFHLFLSPEGENIEEMNAARSSYFKITSYADSSASSEGIAVVACPNRGTPGGVNIVNSRSWRKMWPSASHPSPLFRTQGVRLPLAFDSNTRYYTSLTGRSYYLRLQMEMLLDCRYNPFNEAGKYNEEGNTENWREKAVYVFVPFSATVRDNGGNALYHYVNRETAAIGRSTTLAATRGYWAPGEAAIGDAWLQWFRKDTGNDDRTGILGWQPNRHCCGRVNATCQNGGNAKEFDFFWAYPSGQYMPMPPCGGSLELCVYEGVAAFKGCDLKKALDNGDGADTSLNLMNYSGFWDAVGDWFYEQTRWLLFKSPSVEIVDGSSLKSSDAEADDVEYAGWINRAAKEELSFSTICGTPKDNPATARGTFRSLSGSLAPVCALCRAGVEDIPERLLIGTLMSQYDCRHTVISGECSLLSSGTMLYTEDNQGELKFMALADRQDLMTGTSEAEFCELSPEQYEAINDEGI